MKHIVCVVMLIALSQAATAQTWVDTGESGDWIGHDKACSPGSIPRSDQCTNAAIDQVAVCWTSRPSGECGNASAWCVYKEVPATAPKTGANPGRIYQCKKN